MIYSVGASEGTVAHNEAMVSSPAIFGGDSDAWEPKQRWDQGGRSFIDIGAEDALSLQ
ncbi:hypothetical protein BH10PSE3_BH10PSE3_26870 [soil metagenome]